MRYEINVVNIGSDLATNVTVTDTLPALLAYVTDTSDHGPCVFNNGVLNCDFGSMPSGDSAQVILVASVEMVGTIGNAATVVSSETDLDTTSNRDVDTTHAHDMSAAIGDENNPDVRPRDFYLAQNYPNPFNPTTIISYSLPMPSHVTIAIYNVLGHKIRSFDLGRQTPGRYSVGWDGLNRQGVEVSSGLYFYKLTAGQQSESRKMLLLR